MTILVSLGGHRFVLTYSKAATFVLDVLSAVAAGRAFADVGGIEGGVRVFVTPATTIFLAPQNEIAADEADWDVFPDLSYLDFDFDA